MKKSIITIFSSLLIISCGEKKSNKSLQITGNIKGLKEGTLYIDHIVDSKLVVIDSIKIDGDSHFATDYDLKSPEMFYLLLNRGVTSSIDNSIPFFAEPGKINIDTDLEYFYASAKITGSKNQELYQQFHKIYSQYNQQSLDLTETKINAIKYKKNVSIDSITKKQEDILRRKYLYAINFAVTHNNDEVAPYIALSEIGDVNLKYLDTIQKTMTPKVANSLYGKKLIEFYNVRKKSE